MKTEIALVESGGKESRAREGVSVPVKASKSLTIAVLVDSIAAAYGGPSYSVRRLWQVARDSGARVTVHSTDSFRVRESAKDRELWQPLDCHGWPAVGLRALGYSREMMRGVENCLVKDESVISQHGLWLHYGRVAKNTGNKTRVPVIIHPHGMLEPWALRRSSWKKQLAGRLWEYANLRQAACLRVTSEEELKSVRAFGLKNPVALIPNGIDIEDNERLPARAEAERLLPRLKDRRVALFLSRVHPKKGLPLLLKAWRALELERSGWLLAIAGPDQLDHTDDLKQLIDELNLKDSVIFTGALFGEEKRAAYALADIFVLPSHSENFGVAVTEALAAGVPVIASTGTPWNKLPEQGCGWWIENSIEALTETLREALALSKRELAAMGAKGREWMRRDFAWERLSAEMIEVCEWTLAGGTPPSCVTTD